MASVALVASVTIYFCLFSPETQDYRGSAMLLDLPANRWVKLHQPWSADWRRQSHAGIAYDSKRGTILIFGSNTHGENWDNSVHEFDPVSAIWSTHYPPADPATYRADSDGYAIAGDQQLLPWAMHTYDHVGYDPLLDALVVMSVPEHNPIRKSIPAAKRHPTWIYELTSRRWRFLTNNEKPFPNAFARASAYDKNRDVIVTYGYGIWELGLDRKVWRHISKGRHHPLHINMEYDALRRKFFVFGDHKTCDVWSYTPSFNPGEAGQWEQNASKGIWCPIGQHFPVAYDKENGVFLIVVDNSQRVDKRSNSTKQEPESSSTFAYDPKTHTYHKLKEADMQPLGMNYMMVYDRIHKVFLLVTGDWRDPPTVWALRLNVVSLRKDFFNERSKVLN